MNNSMPFLTQAIIHYLFVGSVTAAVLVPATWGVIKALRIRAPIYRQLLWLYCLIGIAVVPVIWLYAPKLTLAVLPAKVRPAEATVAAAALSSTPAGDYQARVDAESMLFQNLAPENKVNAQKKSLAPRAHTVTAKTVLVALWLGGFAFMLVRLFVGWYRLRRICLSARSAARDKRLPDLAGQKLRLLVTSKVGSPACFGILRPSIILPQHVYENGTAEELAMVLSHELAHIERRDCWTNLFQRLVEAALFFHPLVWLASSQLTRERERICDNYVISRGVSALDYTALLSHIVEQGFEGTCLASVALFEGRLLQRVRFLLDPKRSGKTRLSIKSALICTVAALICFGAFGIIRFDAKAGVQSATPENKATTEEDVSAGPSDPNDVKEDFRDIAESILKYRRKQGYFPSSLKQINQPLPQDAYSPTGEDYHYESNRKRFILSSCGQDGMYGNGDDVLFIGYNHRGRSQSGRRDELYHLEEDEDSNSQTEIVGPSGRRPKGNCSISGRVVSAATGEPIGHAKAYLFHVDTHDAIFIDVATDGSFVFSNIPAGKYSLAMTHTAGFQESAYNPSNGHGRFPPFTLNEDEKLSDVVFELQPAFRISGKVLDENGDPIEDTDGMHVLAWGPQTKDGCDGEYYSSRQANINRVDGTYSLGGLDGQPVYVMAVDWHAYEKDNSYPPRYWPGTFSRSQAKQITFDEEPEVENVDIRLQRGGGLVLEGTVADETTGEPVPEAFVVVHHDDMLFDFVTAYTDEQGRYRIEGLGEGQFLAHVDAVHRGFVRTREPVKIQANAGKTTLDFKLRRGVTISGKIVDEQGNDWQITNSHGHAVITDYPEPERTFSLTNFRNRHRPKDAGRGSGGTFQPGQGDYASGEMIFPTKSTFIFQGMMPSQTVMDFAPKAEGWQVKEILCNGQNIMHTGIETQAGQDVNDVTIVVGSAASESRPSTSDKIEVRQYTLFYTQSGHGYNLKEFNRAENSPILNACLNGATYKELEEFGVDNLSIRLEKLQAGKIVKKVNDRYCLAFPAVVGKKRAKLQQLVEQTALQLLPTSENMIEQIQPHLKGREEMLYHILWSAVMDSGIAWNTVKNDLEQQVKEGNAGIKNTAWLIYPRHPYTCGTNSYGSSVDQIVSFIITWDQNSPEPSRTHRNISKYENELIQSYTQNQPVEGVEARKTLALYGLLNDKGVTKAHIVDVNSEEAQTYKTLASQFAHQFMPLCDIEKVAKMLNITPGQALLIAYHEVCYEVLGQLVDKGVLEIPQKITKSQMCHLITFVSMGKTISVKKK